MLRDPQRLHYGPAPSQFLLLYTPSIAPPYRLVVLLHGGFWKSKYGICPPTAAIETLAPNLLSYDYAVAEVEYRRSDDQGWGYPGTNHDVLAAFHLLSSLDNIDSMRIVLVGHSAGGTLALWLASRLYVEGAVQPLRTFALAPVADLCEAARMELSDDGDAIQNYVGGEPQHVPHEYKEACPMCIVDSLKNVNVTVVVGSMDNDVPQEVIRPVVERIQNCSGTERWECETFDCNHYQLVQAGQPSWLWVLRRIDDAFCRCSR